MERTMVDFLNAPFKPRIMLVVMAAWFLMWHLFLRRLLRKQKVTSIWYQLYELGSIGVFGIVLFLFFIGCLIITFIQLVM